MDPHISVHYGRTPTREEVETQLRDVILEAASVCIAFYSTVYIKTPKHTRLFSGAQMLDDILRGHGGRCYEVFRMKKHVFMKLANLLETKYGVRATRRTPVKEQLAAFLLVICHRQGHRLIQEFLQHSGETISRHMHLVLEGCFAMAKDLVRTRHDPAITQSYIRKSTRHFPYFKDCIGALDGTHVATKVKQEMQIPFFGKSGKTTQNILAVCDFDMCFTFIAAGFDGSYHDSRVFKEVTRVAERGFPVAPPGKFYLGDSGYGLLPGLLIPYRGHRYHLKNFGPSDTYNAPEELFNHRHSSLRMTIERMFGVWKAKFPTVADYPWGYDYKNQVKMVLATAAIHNFIRLTDGRDRDFLRLENWVPQDQRPEHRTQSNVVDDHAMGTIRDEIRDQLWASR